MLPTGGAHSGTNEWIPTGPQGGEIRPLALDASNPLVLYAGTPSGAFVFEDIPTVIPTLPQWGLISLTLGLMTLATWELTGRRQLIPSVYPGGGLVLVGDPALPAKNLRELVSWARASKGKATFASFSAGSLSHVLGLLLNKAEGLDMLHVPYKGRPDERRP